MQLWSWFGDAARRHGARTAAALGVPTTCLGKLFSSGPRDHKVYSQVGEDGILEAVLKCIGVGDAPFYVEFGTESGAECVTRLLREQGWR